MHVIKREEKDKRKRQEGREERMNKSHMSQKKNVTHSRVANEGSTNSYIKMINSKEFESVLKEQKDLLLKEILENTLYYYIFFRFELLAP